MNKTAQVLMLLAAFVLAPRAVLATVMLEVPLPQMVEQADAIVLGRVLHTGTVLSAEPDGLMPWSVTTVGIERWLKGQGPDRITIEEKGGTWLEQGVWIDGTPTYRTGEHVLLLLRRVADRRHTYRTFAMAQGKFNILPGARPEHTLLNRDLSQLSLFRPERQSASVQRTPLERPVVLREIVDLVAQQRTRRRP